MKFETRANKLCDELTDVKSHMKFKHYQLPVLELNKYNLPVSLYTNEKSIEKIKFDDIKKASGEELKLKDKLYIVNYLVSTIAHCIKFEGSRYNVTETGITPYAALFVLSQILDRAQVVDYKGTAVNFPVANASSTDIVTQITDEMKGGAKAVLMFYMMLYLRKSAVVKGVTERSTASIIVQTLKKQANQLSVSKIEFKEIDENSISSLFMRSFVYADCFLSWCIEKGYVKDRIDGITIENLTIVIDEYLKDYPNEDEEITKRVNSGIIIAVNFLSGVKDILPEFKLNNEINTVELLNQFVACHNLVRELLLTYGGQGKFTDFLKMVHSQLQNVVSNLHKFFPNYHKGCPNYQGGGLSLVDKTPVIVELLATIGGATAVAISNTGSNSNFATKNPLAEIMTTPFLAKSHRFTILHTTILRVLASVTKEKNTTMYDLIMQAITTTNLPQLEMIEQMVPSSIASKDTPAIATVPAASIVTKTEKSVPHTDSRKDPAAALTNELQGNRGQNNTLTQYLESKPEIKKPNEKNDAEL